MLKVKVMFLDDHVLEKNVSQFFQVFPHLLGIHALMLCLKQAWKHNIFTNYGK